MQASRPNPTGTDTEEARMTLRHGTAALFLAVLAVGCRSSSPAPPPAPASPPAEPAAAPAPASPSAPSPIVVMPVATPVSPVAVPPEAPAPTAPEPPPPAAAVPQQAPGPAAPDRPYLDILKLKQAGLSDDFLLNKIRTENVNYQLTTAEILQLRSAGASETVLDAMLRSGLAPASLAGTPVAHHAEFPGLARVSKGFLGVFGTSTKSVGRLVVDGDKISWTESEDPSKNFSVYAKNLKETYNTCVLRPGENLCLEFGLVTYTGDEYRFRDPGWKNGDNRTVSEVTDYFRRAFPSIFFSQRAVNEM